MSTASAAEVFLTRGTPSDQAITHPIDGPTAYRDVLAHVGLSAYDVRARYARFCEIARNPTINRHATPLAERSAHAADVGEPLTSSPLAHL